MISGYHLKAKQCIKQNLHLPGTLIENHTILLSLKQLNDFLKRGELSSVQPLVVGKSLLWYDASNNFGMKTE